MGLNIYNCSEKTKFKNIPIWLTRTISHIARLAVLLVHGHQNFLNMFEISQNVTEMDIHILMHEEIACKIDATKNRQTFELLKLNKLKEINIQSFKLCKKVK